ncbi:GATOR2 complex protein WDR59-like isoform X3 [Babylonia areolata]|uniref:GATOR2 complex protein WDR59-like isoform X3 n=1 Tax=Babylonia areolata TaxID=304850 RepID=UPI003FD5F85C
MAVQWSSETFVEEFKDLQANAMAVDCLGTYAVLAGKKTLAYVNLENPDEEEDGSNVTRVTRQSKWDISCVQFNPHASHAHLFVTACNQRLDINQLTDKTGNPLCSLKAHSRIISDVDWSPFDVNIVASCSIDCFTYLWDIREAKKPVHSFQTVAGAYQVKWNKVTNNLFATTHEGDIRIWDPRKGNTPQQYIAAHLSKIHGLDWNPNDQYQFVTASQDGYVRLWDYTNPKKCYGSMDSGAPVRRARYTPFGAGLVTVVLPQLKRGENSLYLWKIMQQSQMQPIHTFVGHKDAVLEFHWKKQNEGVRDQQLVTWSRDQSLRIWRIDPNLQRLCGHDSGEVGEVVDLTGTSYNSSESTLKDLRDLTLGESTVDEDLGLGMAAGGGGGGNLVQQSLQWEFNSLRTIPNVTYDQMDHVNRMCRVTGVATNHKVVVECLFPAAYPNGSAPAFQIIHTTLDAAMQSRMLKVLNDTALKYVKRNTNCMEMCLRQMMSILDSFDDRRSPDSEVPYSRGQPTMQASTFLPMYSLGSFQDTSVPFPRTSGARFCSNGMLVAFGVPAEMKKVSGGSEVTPKALSDLAAFAQTSWMGTGPVVPFSMSFFSRSPPTPSTDAVSISSFFEPKGKRASRHSHMSSRRRRHEREGGEKASRKQQSVGKVKLYNVEPLIGISRHLAQHYIMDLNDIEGTCRHNRTAAAAIGRKDLVQIWSMVETMSCKKLHPGPFPQQDMPWAMSPFGRPLLKYILEQYAAQFDVQTLALLCCLFWSPDLKPRVPVQRSTSKTSLEFTPPNTDANITFYQTGSSTDSGWSLLPNFTSHPIAPPLRVDPPTSSQAPPTHPSSSHMSEVASQPNLAALFKAGGTQNVSETAVAKSKRSLSWSDTSDIGDEFRYSDPVEHRDREEDEKQQHEDNCKMLNPVQWEQYDRHKLAYANILYNWRLFNQRAMVLKFISSPMPQHKGVEFAVCCHKCGKEMRGPQCSWCKYPALRCSICHIAVRGLSNFCLVCSHGGHTAHMKEWFRTQTVCPTGCGCNCMKENFFGI